MNCMNIWKVLSTPPVFKQMALYYFLHTFLSTYPWSMQFSKRKHTTCQMYLHTFNPCQPSKQTIWQQPSTPKHCHSLKTIRHLTLLNSLLSLSFPSPLSTLPQPDTPTHTDTHQHTPGQGPEQFNLALLSLNMSVYFFHNSIHAYCISTLTLHDSLLPMCGRASLIRMSHEGRFISMQSYPNKQFPGSSCLNQSKRPMHMNSVANLIFLQISRLLPSNKAQSPQ